MKKNINKKTKLIVAIISTTVFAIICTAMIIGGLMIENDDCVVAGAMLLIIFIPMFLWWIFTLVKIKNTISSNHLATNPFKDKILEKITDINLGKLGFFSKNKVDIDSLIESAQKLSNEENEQIEYIVKTYIEWKNIIENNSQYIINYFSLSVLIESDMTDNPFWENYLTDKNYDDEQCLEIFREVYGDSVFSESLNKYYEQATKEDVAQMFKDKFPFFNYEKFIEEVKVEYITIDDDIFSIQMSDKYSNCLCCAYEQFDKNMKGQDWHNF